MRVIVTGRLKQREYNGSDGTRRTDDELAADDIGPSLKWATAKIAKTLGGPDASADHHGPAVFTLYPD